MDTCYRCKANSVSREHIPPVCLFPKDEKYRINLITVPSCSEHNLKKSIDDEYFRVFLLQQENINDIGDRVLDIVFRQFDRKPKLALELYLASAKYHAISPPGKLIGEIDFLRITNILNLISYGLFYHINNNQFFGSISHVCPSTLSGSVVQHQKEMEIYQFTRQYLSVNKENIIGENKKIFAFSYNVIELNKFIMIHSIYYESIHIYSYLAYKI